MAELRELNGDRRCVLQPEHLIGRGTQCALRLAGKYISSQHALIRWQGNHWELIDRGSRNGTRLNGQLLASGRAYTLDERATITFGHPEERWVLACAAEPQALVMNRETGETVLGVDGVIVLPPAGEPECSLYRDLDGTWRLEHLDRTTPIYDGEKVDIHGDVWHFHCPVPIGETVAAEAGNGIVPSTIELAHSKCEEYVKLAIQYPDRRVELGSRTHNYLLLTLARARVDDAKANVAEAACGWMTKEELGDKLKMQPQHVDGEVFRIRQHLAQHGVAEAATIIERRARTRQLRLGISRIRITRI